MKKELKDYLHLYLGCEVETEGAKKIILTTELLAKVINGKIGVTPILRPLSNANESERHKLSMFETIPGGTDYLGVLKNEAERTLYLSRRHFDIFGLIEAGLAIDKTTL